MKHRPILFSTPMVKAILEGRKNQTRRVVKARSYISDVVDGVPYEMTEDDSQPIKCPYGYVDDVLWVREKWAPIIDDTGKRIGFYHSTDTDIYTGKWKPSIHMPKEACRLFIKIKSIRVERLQDISEEDAKLEGVESWVNERLKSKPTIFKNYLQNEDAWFCSKAYTSFHTLWELINGKESWDANPWVWVIEFEKIKKPI